MKLPTIIALFAAVANGSAQTYTFTTFAGEAGFGSDDGTGGAARFHSPSGTAVDTNGNVFVADVANGTIRMISAGGFVTTLAGLAGFPGSADGLGGAARRAQRGQRVIR